MKVYYNNADNKHACHWTHKFINTIKITVNFYILVRTCPPTQKKTENVKKCLC